MREVRDSKPRMGVVRSVLHCVHRDIVSFHMLHIASDETAPHALVRSIHMRYGPYLDGPLSQVVEKDGMEIFDIYRA